MSETALSVVSERASDVGERLRGIVVRNPVAALAASVGAGVLLTGFGAKGLLRLASAGWLLKLGEEFGPELKKARNAVLGAAVVAVADRVKHVKPALSPTVEELEKSVLARISESEKEWRPSGN